MLRLYRSYAGDADDSLSHLAIIPCSYGW